MHPKLTELISPILSKNRGPLTAPERMEYIRDIRKLIVVERKKILNLHREHIAGKEISRELTQMVDTVVLVIFECLMEKPGDFTIIALGGYGREDLQPFSDVDLLFLYRDHIQKTASIITNSILSVMWDIGFDIGHGSRSLRRCLDLIITDIPSKTAAIDARFLAGDKELFKYFVSSVNKEITKNSVDKFIDAKAEELEIRHKKYGGTVFVVEPNVKEGAGALRDYHTALWTSAARFGVNSLSGLMQRGIIDRRELDTVTDSVDFLFRVRNELHFLTGKREDTLLHEYQERVAKNLGYRENGRGVETFMTDFYKQMVRIHRFSSGILHICQTYKKFSRFTLIRIKRKKIGNGFETVGNLIFLDGYNPNMFRENPALIIQAFLLCGTSGFALSEPLKKKIVSSLDLLTDSVIGSVEVKEMILKIFRGETPGRILRMMHETDILGRILKEFKDITYLSPRDYYHLYTIDEHTLRGIETLDCLSISNEDPEMSTLYREVKKREFLILAVLMHDVGKKSVDGHAERGAEIAKRVLEKWGFSEDSGITVELIRHHLLMSHTAFRREINDPDVIKEFCQVVKNVEQLKRLYLLTYADIKSVSTGIWSNWKKTLLRNLYLRVYMHMESQEASPDIFLMEKKKTEILAELPDRREEILYYFSVMPEKYILSVPLGSIYKHIDFMKTLDTSKVSMGVYKKGGFAEFLVCTLGRPGIFSMICGVLASHNLNILGCQIYTRKDRIIADTFQVSNPLETVLSSASNSKKQGSDRDHLENDIWERVKRDIELVVDGKIDVKELISTRMKGKTGKTGVSRFVPRVGILNDLSNSHTVIEMISGDRIGLLYQISDLLFQKGFNLDTAKIITEGNTCINVFYVTDLAGNKVYDEERLIDLKGSLAEIFFKGLS